LIRSGKQESCVKSVKGGGVKGRVCCLWVKSAKGAGALSWRSDEISLSLAYSLKIVVRSTPRGGLQGGKGGCCQDIFTQINGGWVWVVAKKATREGTF